MVIAKNENLTPEINSAIHPQREQKHGEFSSRKRQIRFFAARFARKPDKKVSKTIQYSCSFLGTY